MKAKCLSPIDCWRCGYLFAKKDSVISPRLVFSRDEARMYLTGIYPDRNLSELMDEFHMTVPCGKCYACQMRKRKDMVCRLSNEASLYEKMCFITLTYDPESVPTTNEIPWKSPEKVVSRGSHGSKSELPCQTLLPRDIQLFMKRLRRHLEYVPKGCSVVNGQVFDKEGNFVRDHVSNLRYFAVGEYGSKSKRPHYHILIFGWQPSDAELFFVRRGNPIYLSKQLQDLWKYGYSSFGSVNGGVARYCARYVTKKFRSLDSWPLARVVCPEFILQSTRNGAIGASWFDKFGEHACQVGYVNVRGSDGSYSVKFAVPQYYKSRLRSRNLQLWLKLRDQAITFCNVHRSDDDCLDDLRQKCITDGYQQEFYDSCETF